METLELRPSKNKKSQEPTADFPAGEEKFFAKLNESINGPCFEDKDQKQAVWEDDDDTAYIPLVKRVRHTQEESAKKFRKIVGEPSWAQKPAADSSDEDDKVNFTGGLIVSKSSTLNDGLIGIRKLKNLNRSTYSERNVTSIIFHPTSTVALCSGQNGIVNIYAVDGKKNEKLHSVGFKDFEVTDTKLVGGQELFVGGKKPFFYTYDLLSSKSSIIHLPKPVTKLKNFVVSPDEKLLAVQGRFGEIHLLTAKSKELVKTLKQEENVSSLCFSLDSKKLFCHSVANEVTIFDLTTFRVVHRFIDEGCVHGSKISVQEHLLATGSAEGVVNIYDKQQVFKTKYPTPKKAILNLTTKITEVKFNATNELLAIASNEVIDAVKLVHFPSATVFANFPGLLAKIGQPTVVEFSPQSGFMAIGNRDSTVALYRLKHYENY